MDEELDCVAKLEFELLTPTCRGDRRRVGELLHVDFVEYGASGRTLNRQTVLGDLEASPVIDGRAVDVVTTRLADEVVLVTCRIVGPRPSLWSSLWVLTGDTWRPPFHQGTLTEKRSLLRPKCMPTGTGVDQRGP